MSIISQGLLVSGLGLAGVFAVLILFYIITRIMLAITQKKPTEAKK
jgi:Na+-transporting methylmalonyl-CoA/oxaloacetate decarboxylase gamma subunit